LPVAFYGASTGAAAALIAAARLDDLVAAVVSRGGRADLAGSYLSRVTAPTLLIVGERDTPVLELNEIASTRMRCERELIVVPRATHLFEEHGALEQVAAIASGWFMQHFGEPAPRFDHGFRPEGYRPAAR
jgi:putative phosphoribosyl transferase